MSDAIRQVSENGEIREKFGKSPTTTTTTTTTTTYRLLGPRSVKACSRSKKVFAAVATAVKQPAGSSTPLPGKKRIKHLKPQGQ